MTEVMRVYDNRVFNLAIRDALAGREFLTESSNEGWRIIHGTRNGNTAGELTDLRKVGLSFTLATQQEADEYIRNIKLVAERYRAAPPTFKVIDN